MSLQELANAITMFVREHPGWALPIVFLLAFGESLCLVSLVWPATVILAGVVSVIAVGGGTFQDLWPAIIAAGLGGTLGYAVSYWIGLYFKDSIASIWPFRTHPRLLPRGERFFAKYGFISAFLGHFFGPIRGVIPLAAGMFGMKQSQFMVANATSAFLWAAGVIGSSYLIFGFAGTVGAFLRGHEMLVALAMFAIAFANAIPNLMTAVPSLLVFIGLALLHVFSGGSLVPLAIAGALGAFAGDYCFYRQGVRGVDFTTQRLIDADPEDVRDVRVFLARHGTTGILASKFLGMKRCLVPLLAGADGMPPGRFFPASAVSAVVWSLLLLAPIYAAPALLEWLSQLTGITWAPPSPAAAPARP